MKANHFSKYGDISLDYNPCSGDKLLSPDKTLQLLPCEICMELTWLELNVVSFVCSECVDMAKEIAEGAL